MTLPPDIRTPPSGDAGFERHYHAGSQEMPGAAADAAVLALARAVAAESRLRASVEVGGGDRGARGWSRRWQAPLALAACLVLTIGVVTRMQTQLPDVTAMPDSAANKASGPPASPAPQPAAEPAPVAAAAPSSPRPEPTRVQPGLTASAEKTGDSRRATAPAAEAMSASGTPSVAAPNPAPAAVLAPPPQPRNETVATDRKPEAAEAGKARMVDAAGAAPAGNLAMKRNQEVPPAAAPAMTQDAAASSEQRARARMAAPKPGAAEAGTTAADEGTLTPQAWLARIIELRSNGRVAEADASLKRFRERHPSVQVPPAALGQPE